MNNDDVDVATRLRAVMAELDLKNPGLADLCETTPNVVSNWLAESGKSHKNGAPVKHMIPLCEKTGLTLDWIYRGQLAAMDPHLAMRLAQRIASGDIKQKVERAASYRSKPQLILMPARRETERRRDRRLG